MSSLIRLNIGFQYFNFHLYGPDGDAPGVGQGEGAAGGVEEGHVEGDPGQRDDAAAGAVVGIGQVEAEPAGDEVPGAEPGAEPFGESTEEGEEDTEVVGVGGQGMGGAELPPDGGGEHGAWIDAARLGVELGAGAAEDLAEGGGADRGDVADEFELVVIEPFADPLGDIGEQRHPVG